MKRSEAIRLIKLELHKRMGSYASSSHWLDDVSNKILTKLENNGMLPPKEKINQNWRSLDDNSKNEYYISEWEPEDDSN
jgi:hypothetical protein